MNNKILPSSFAQPVVPPVIEEPEPEIKEVIGPHTITVDPISKKGFLDGQPINGVEMTVVDGTISVQEKGAFVPLKESQVGAQLRILPSVEQIASEPLSAPAQASDALAQVGAFVPPTRTEIDQNQITQVRYNMEEPQSFLQRYGLLILIGAGAFIYGSLQRSYTSPDIPAKSSTLKIKNLKEDLRAKEKQEKVLDAEKEELQQEIIDEST